MNQSYVAVVGGRDEETAEVASDVSGSNTAEGVEQAEVGSSGRPLINGELI